MKVTLNIPDKLWARLASVADNQGSRVSTLLEEAIKEIIQPEPKPEPLTIPRSEADARVNAQIDILRGLGYSVTEISKRVGMSTFAIRYRMQQLGLETGRVNNNANRKAS